MLFRFAVVTLLIAFARGDAEIKYEEDVMVLTTDNFESAVADNAFVLVEFYAPWCGHCKALAPEYAKAAQQLKEEGAEPKLAKVDATQEQKLAEKFSVQGYPTLKFFKNGKPVDYTGARQAADIVSWLKKKTGPAATILASKEAADKFKQDADVVVIAHFTDADCDEAKAFTTVADGIDDIPFGIISDAAVAKDMNIADKKITVLRKFDEPMIQYDGEFDAAEIKKFIKGNQLPLVSEFTQESAPKIFGGQIEVHNLLFVKKSDEGFDTKLTNFKAAAAKFKGKVLFIYIDGDNEENGRVMEFFGLSKEDCPDYRIIKMSDDMAKFKPPTKDLDTESIVSFTQDVLDGKIKRHHNTEEIPDDWNKNPVHVLVGKNFREVAFDANKKVFIEFYAPWCGHCKQLAPIWDKLGEHYKDNDNVVIAKMDATANEVDEVKVTGFPTLKFFKDDKMENMIDYNGDRTLEAMIKFIDSDGVEVSGEVEEEIPEIVPRNDTLDELNAQFPMDDGLQISKEVIGGDEENATEALDSAHVKPTHVPTASTPAAGVHGGTSPKTAAPTESPVTPAVDQGKVYDEELHKHLAGMTDAKRQEEHVKSEKTFEEQIAALNAEDELEEEEEDELQEEAEPTGAEKDEL